MHEDQEAFRFLLHRRATEPGRLVVLLGLWVRGVGLRLGEFGMTVSGLSGVQVWVGRAPGFGMLRVEGLRFRV